MKETINIGIIGCGWIMEHAHIPVLVKNKNVTIVAAFDTDLERARTLCEKYGILHSYNNIDEFLECDLDGVIISTPNYTHYTYTMQAIEKGISVLCEKPITLKETEITEILEKANEKGVIYVPGFVNRWRQDIKSISHEIQNGTIGEVKRVEAGWLRKSGVPRPGTWFTYRKYAGGGVLVDLGSHIIDLCLLFIGEGKPVNFNLNTAICNYEKIEKEGAANWFKREEATSLNIDVEETAIATVKFENDKSIDVKLSWRAPIKADCTYFRLIGTKGNIELKTLFGFSNNRLWEEDSLTINNGHEKKALSLNKIENNSAKAFHEMLSLFIRVLRTKTKSEKNYHGALNTVSLIEKLYACEVIDEDFVQTRLQEEI